MNSGKPEQEFQRAGTGVPASRNRSSSEIAGISPCDGKSVNYSLFTYRQLFVDVVELSTYLVITEREPTACGLSLKNRIFKEHEQTYPIEILE
jgi:hypothetical protein